MFENGGVLVARDERGRFTEPASGMPASGRLAQPYEPGNTAALRHGATSPRVVKPLAAEIASELLERRPDLERYPDALEAYAQALARIRLIRAWHDEVGMIDPDKGEVRAARSLAQAEAATARLRERLGLDPRGEIELVKLQHEVMDHEDAIAAIIERAKTAEIGTAPASGGGGPYV